MGIALHQIVFFVAAILIIVCSILTVTTKHLLRSATYLLIVLFSTAMLYFLLDYTFLGAAQIIVYAGGIVVLYVFSIFLTRSNKSLYAFADKGKLASAAVAAIAGGVILLMCILSHSFALQVAPTADNEVTMDIIGQALTGTGKYQYLLPFEAVSILLLACIVGGIVIARKK